MFCTESGEHGIHGTSSGRLINYQSTPVQSNDVYLQQQLQCQSLKQQQQQPHAPYQQQPLNMCYAPLRVAEPCNEPEMEPARVGMCFVTERPEGLSIDCNVPIPNSFNLDAYRPQMAYPPHSNYFAMSMQQQNERFCIPLPAPAPTLQMLPSLPPPATNPSPPQGSNYVPVAATSACYDSSLPLTSQATGPLQCNSNASLLKPATMQCSSRPEPQTQTQSQTQSQIQPQLHLQQPPTGVYMDCACLLNPIPMSEQGGYFYGTFPMLPTTTAGQPAPPQPPSAPPAPAPAPAAVQQQPQQPQQQPSTTWLRFDIPCLLTELRSENSSREAMQPLQIPLALQFYAPMQSLSLTDCLRAPATATAMPEAMVESTTTAAPPPPPSPPPTATATADAAPEGATVTATASTATTANGATAMPKPKCMNRNKDDWNVQHCAGNVCMKCGNGNYWHCSRCSNCFWHPGLLRLAADKNNSRNQRR
ncbi:protein enabled homolog [Scaptodrosophila lebanonensis]|uniref:Protein enabled homolog n=1 Tax=Drosophila lebanonensis TaxID=7225 RepID=A0A6J2TC35_DROLE|nr:protein enabled homolog [Scaptodrosophila lebanonensis]